MRLVVDANVVVSSLLSGGVPFKEIKEFVPKAEKMLSGHLKDVPYLALALKLECPIFSGDKVLKRLSPVRVCSPRELLDTLLGLTRP
ncbi:MAG: PIN domain-containing protein [Halobacteriota archaeon]